jgi:hypothetical protein
MVRYLFIILAFYPVAAMSQDWNFGVAEKLSVNVNTECDEVLPLISPDGKWLYFTRALCNENRGGRFTGTDIWISRFDPTINDWGRANNDIALNDRGNSAAIGTSTAGDILYMLKTTSTRRPDGIYAANKLNDSWGRPWLLPVTGLEPDEYLGAFVSPDQTVMIISMNGPDSRGREDLYISLKNEKGEWTKPKNMGATVNSAGFELSPFLSSNKRRLYFASSGHPGLGNGDIFYSDRLYDSWEIWSAPKNLGENVNSKAFDAYFSIYGDTVAYFSSNRFKQMDIFKSSVREKKSLLDEDRRNYLTDEEIQKITGTVLQPLLYFDVGTSELNDYQKQNLIKIKNSLSVQKEIKFNIIAMKPPEGKLEIYQSRLLNILDYLKEAGIPGDRIMFSTEQSAGTIQNKEMVRIRFYKQ